MSINLLVDRADPDRLAAMLAEAAPDVLAVQELGTRTAAVISSILPHGHLDPQPSLFGLGIAARRPVTVSALPLDLRSGWVARLDSGDWPDLSQAVEVVDIHLVNPVDRPWRKTAATRRAQVDGVTRHVEASSVPTVIIGDMNTTRWWPEYQRLTALGVDAAKATGSIERTWAHFVRGPRWIRIDHAFVSGAVPVGTKVVRVAGSDHRGLVVDIEI